MAATTIGSDFGGQKMKSDTVSPSICHEVVGPNAMILVFWMLSYFTSVWDECNCAVAWAFFGSGMKTDLFQSCGHLLWQEYTEVLYIKDLHDPDNHDAVITHLEPDILECEVNVGLRKHYYE